MFACVDCRIAHLCAADLERQGLSIFSAKGNNTEKLRFAFRVYDMDRDGYISNGELFTVLKMMVGDNLKDDQLQQVVDKTIMYADKDGVRHQTGLLF